MSTPLPAVSVVIPTHQRPQFLRESVASVLGQTLAPAELVVVSDVPDAESRAIVEELAAGSTVQVTFLERDGVPGASASRNAGAHASTAPLVAFLDDDDRWLPTFLERTVAALTDAEADAGVAWIRMFLHGDERTAPGEHIAEVADVREAAAKNPGVTGSNIVVRRTAFDAIEGFDANLPVKNDTDFIFRFLLAGFCYARVAEELVEQRKHESGQLTGRTFARAAGLQRYMDKHRAHLNLAGRRAIRLQIHRIRYHAHTNKVAKLWELVCGAWNSTPSSIMASRKNRAHRDFWLRTGFSDEPATTNES